MFRSLLTVAVFVVATITVGRWIVVRSLAFVQDRMKGRDRLLTLIVVLAFLWAGFTQWLRLEPVLGAFAIGILFGQMRRLPSEVSHKLEGAALAIFSPIFFAVAGLKVDIPSLAKPRLLRPGHGRDRSGDLRKSDRRVSRRPLPQQAGPLDLARLRSRVECPGCGRDHRRVDRTFPRDPFARKCSRWWW